MNRSMLLNPTKKRDYNKWIFTEIASKYSFMSKILSLGRDAAWKQYLVEALPEKTVTCTCLDLACGDGDVSFLLAERFPQADVTGVDLSVDMLGFARKNNDYPNVKFVQQDMCELQNADESVDLLTGSYAIRNAPDLSKVLKQIHRVLKPDGTAAFLEFSKPQSKFLQLIEYVFLKTWCSLSGFVVQRNSRAYGYIADSLLYFPDRVQLRTLFKELGFDVVYSRKLYLGIFEIIVFSKVKKLQ